MSDNMRMPGAWESDSEEPSTTAHSFVDSQPREPPQPNRRASPPPYPPPPQRRHIPLPATTQGRNISLLTMTQSRKGRHIPLPTTAKGRHIPPPTVQNRRASFPQTTKPVSEYGFFADSSDDENGDAVVDQKKPIVIAVLGKTGSGKTSLIKAVTGKDLKVGHGLTSCTEDVLPVSCRIGNENVILVDTPGFSDTNVTDTEILRRIAEWMKDFYDDGFLLSGIIYLYRYSNGRSLKNVVLATTMWEKVDKNKGLERELELQNNFWKDMIGDGSTVASIMSETGGEARELVISLLKNKPLSTKLQEELQGGKTLDQTEAGTEIREDIVKLVQQLKKEKEADIAELKLAKESHCDA
ncbi:hypothetical protein V502_08879 [Pseudogymnoascus sp. VKM F-4520 (FW-2644)]|nr:hypothetical protein V502_08879 [Pseudogymnoascus sp. VKM F-4520 (FW-2644)]